MHCPACGQENRAGRKFCAACGAALAGPCPACGAENQPGERFCGECGKPLAGAAEARSDLRARAPDPRAYTPKHLAEKILTSRSALEGERKQVTVLFADVKGSMELASAVDAEEWHTILDRFFAILFEGIHRFEGTINQYTGDGIMALFGAPIAHEDHAARACFAALRLRDELRRYGEELKRRHGVVFSVRMGLNSGEVVVGKIGDDLRMDYTAQGETVGLAARMEALADAGTAYLSERTAALVSGLFALRDLGPFEVKGAPRPLHVFELEGLGRLHTRLEVARSRGFTRFVGRGDEIRTLEAALARAREGDGQVVGVVGTPGVGKSRLCFEFLERCRAEGLQPFEGRAVSHGKNIPFLPMLEAFRAYYGITERDDARVAREKIAGRLLLLDEGFRESLPLLFDFFGVTDPERPPQRLAPEARQRNLFGLLRRVLQTQRETMVTLIEDLHWMDPGSGAFLEQWAEAIADTPHLLVVNFRPEYHARWMERSYYQQLSLRPLGAVAARELLRALLGGGAGLDELADKILERTAGNPFFTEEAVQMLAETGHLDGSKGGYRLVSRVEALSVPPSVQAVLAARIDRLAERDKLVLQTAAVLGKTFAESVLRRISPTSEEEIVEALSRLVHAELVYESALYPEAEYAFKHPLTQEVAYQSQLRDRRAGIHAAAARVLADVHADALDEKAALIGHHWEAAGERLEAARWVRRAAGWAGVNSPSEALRHWRKVRELLLDLPSSEDVDRLALEAHTRIIGFGFRQGIDNAEVEGALTEGRRLATSLGDDGALATLLLQHGGYCSNRAAPLEALATFGEALVIAEALGDRELRFATRFGIFYAQLWAGRLNDALVCNDEALEIGRDDLRLGASSWGFGLAWSHGIRGWILFELGRLTEARAALERSITLLLVAEEHEPICWARNCLAFIHAAARDGNAALDQARSAVEAAERLGSSLSRVAARCALGVAHVSLGAWKEAILELERSLSIAAETGAGHMIEWKTLPALAEALTFAGDIERAIATAEKAVWRGRQNGMQVMEADGLITLARARLAADSVVDRAIVESSLDRAAELIAATGARRLEPSLHLARAEQARALCDTIARERELREAHRVFFEIGAPLRAAEIEKELAASSVGKMVS